MTYICRICNKEFKYRSSRSRHQMTCGKARSHACTRCEKLFVRKDALKRHLSSCNPDRKNRFCEICGKFFKSNWLLERHGKHVHNKPEKLYDCKMCSMKFRRKVHLGKHMKESHGPNTSSKFHSLIEKLVSAARVKDATTIGDDTISSTNYNNRLGMGEPLTVVEAKDFRSELHISHDNGGAQMSIEKLVSSTSVTNSATNSSDVICGENYNGHFEIEDSIPMVGDVDYSSERYISRHKGSAEMSIKKLASKGQFKNSASSSNDVICGANYNDRLKMVESVSMVENVDRISERRISRDNFSTQSSIEKFVSASRVKTATTTHNSVANCGDHEMREPAPTIKVEDCSDEHSISSDNHGDPMLTEEETSFVDTVRNEDQVQGNIKMDGATIFAKSLATQGVEYMFGIVGVPVIELAVAAQAAGIKFIGMRNEQAASYAASAVGFLTGRPAVCLVASGPALVHALAGMSGAKENCWPLIVAGGSCDKFQQEMGGFQELKQVEVARPFCKFSAGPNTVEDIPFYIEKAVRNCIQGRPGVSYIDMPADLITGSAKDDSDIRWMAKSPSRYISCAPQENISAAVKLLASAQRPLIIVGKGAAYGNAENEVRALVDKTGIPFLPSAMGKGVVSDHHPQCVSAARSRALLQADVILLLGARLNWMLHFGLPPRFNPNVKIIQVDISPEEIGNNVLPTVPLHGDVRAISHQICNEFDATTHPVQMNKLWWEELREKINDNMRKTEAMISSSSNPMNFYKMYHEMNSKIPKDSIIVNEGANTMDIGRTMILHDSPRCRLDAGTFGAMGVGAGYAIAAALIQQSEARRSGLPPKKVICIQGDSAFGFGGMELETAARYKLPIVFVIANNNGIYNGLDLSSWNELFEDCDQESLPLRIPPVALDPQNNYEKMIEAFHCAGYEVNNVDELHSSFSLALAETDRPSLIHVHVETTSQRKPQEFDWLTKSKL